VRGAATLSSDHDVPRFVSHFRERRGEAFFFPADGHLSRGVILWGARSLGHVILTWSRGCGCNILGNDSGTPLRPRCTHEENKDPNSRHKVLLIKESCQVRRSISFFNQNPSSKRNYSAMDDFDKKFDRQVFPWLYVRSISVVQIIGIQT